MGALRDTGIALSQVRRVPYRDAFLIGDLLTSRITLLSGEPKAGKTLLAVGMVTALLDGSHDFLGLPVHRQLQKVVFGLTDDGAKEELRERFATDEDKVTVFSVTDTGSPSYWADLNDDLRSHGADLFVLDNILGSLGNQDDISSSVTATAVIRNLRPISEAGIPVLAITHTPKGAIEGSNVASSPIGGRAIGGGARGIIALRKSAGSGRRVQTAINRARQDLDLAVEVGRKTPDSEVPVWTVRQQTRQVRGQETADKVSALVERILKDQPAEDSMRAVAKRYAADYGWRAETARSKLKGRITHDGAAWIRCGGTAERAA